MKTPLFDKPDLLLTIGLLALLLSACVVTGGGYGYDEGAGFGPDYYEPYGSYYGGWGSGYRIAPMPRDSYRFDRGAGNSRPHAYRSAPSSRPVPSIPAQRRRSGGAREH